jgi:hypothetical protein
VSSYEEDLSIAFDRIQLLLDLCCESSEALSAALSSLVTTQQVIISTEAEQTMQSLVQTTVQRIDSISATLLTATDGLVRLVLAHFRQSISPTTTSYDHNHSHYQKQQQHPYGRRLFHRDSLTRFSKECTVSVLSLLTHVLRLLPSSVSCNSDGGESTRRAISADILFASIQQSSLVVRLQGLRQLLTKTIDGHRLSATEAESTTTTNNVGLIREEYEKISELR